MLQSLDINEFDEPLYEGASITTMHYHKEIFDFGNAAHLSEAAMNKLLLLIHKALPDGNKMVKNFKKLTSIFQYSSSFTESKICAHCLITIDEENVCSDTCRRNTTDRSVEDIVEFIKMDSSKKQLIDIIRRNKQMIIDYPRVVDEISSCDIMTAKVYRERFKNKITSDDTASVTLMLHIDGFPLVHWTKKHTWLFTASIIEIPPFLRENKFNMILVSLW